MVFVIQLLFGFKLNNFTVNIPIFIMAIGIADSIHIFTI
jgi:predicted RND superfamily exporter protein